MKGRKPQDGAVRRGLRDSYGLAKTDEKVGLIMPADIAQDPVQSEFWAMLVPPVNRFTTEDEPILRRLVYWHAVAAQAEKEMACGDGIDIADKESLRALKVASTEIRALSDMLGVSPLARSRIGLMNATTVKTAAETASMFKSIDAAYELPEAVIEDA